jgi:hypothetical protein
VPEGRSQGGAQWARAPPPPLGKKCLEEDTGIKKTIRMIKDFLRWRAPLQKIPVYDPWRGRPLEGMQDRGLFTVILELNEMSIR